MDHIRGEGGDLDLKPAVDIQQQGLDSRGQKRPTGKEDVATRNCESLHRERRRFRTQ